MDVRNLIGKLSTVFLRQHAATPTNPARPIRTLLADVPLRPRPRPPHPPARAFVLIHRMQPADRIFVYGDPNSYGGSMKSIRTNNPLLILAAAVLTAAAFVGLAWRAHEWFGW